ncbi:hypothetical protein GCM10011519_15710 [Marmoricola endophyticus]|uniref:Type IV secretion protein Rhs n=1 Tax=Marmoricola endophyticus TaxID=2040280 RepID=A0A917BJZ2_9ACTN|nr:DUF6531 domain-containing protein [Marmoricola endophyticus]GGF42677.1 hypothetical protein GCM10011519_15710 [Marmoricola endophyticus]
MGDPMKGIESDVRFAFDAAGRLERLCDHSASQIDGQAGSRASYVTTAMKDFEGHYSELFTTNANTAKADASEIASALRTTAGYVRDLVREAHEENKRRADARAWKKQHDNRGFGGWLDDHFGDGDDCPIPDPKEPINHHPSAPPAKQRQPLSGGGGAGGTSSARPEDLRSFATGSSTLNGVLHGRPSSLSSVAGEFTSGTDWGTLDASGVFTAFSTWMSQNANDVHWARTVADAFAAAGGSGSVSSLPNSSIGAALQAAGVNASRQDITITMPTAIGHPPTTGYANDPVNTATGNFVETESDLEFGQGCADLWWRRSYNSVHDHDGPYGRGWSSWCEAGLSFTDEAAAFTTPDGRQVSFPRLGEGWDRAEGESLWLTREGELLVVSDNQGRRWSHRSTGRLVSVSQGAGTTVTARWDGDRLVALSHERGRAISIEWDLTETGHGERIVAVHASDGRSVGYSYDADGLLVAATGPLGTRRYAWNDEATHRIASVTDADGVVEVENVYDEHGRVVSQRSPFGRTTRFAYLPGRVTVVSDEDGTRANTWIADAKGRQVGVIDAHDQRQSTAYDAYGNTVMVTERDGTVTIREYDDRGRMVREVVPDGADVTYDYDDADRVVRVEVTGGDPTIEDSVDAGEGTGQVAVTTMTYTGDQRSPSTITDPEGGLTRMEWDGGLLQRVTDPMGVVVVFGYDAHGELTTTTDALGNVATLERDDAGRVVAATTPSGARTTYAYDEHSGLLATRTGPDDAVWAYEQTAAGRQTVVVDPLGGRTEVEYDSAGEAAATIDPIGRAIRRTYDDLGNLAGAELPDGSRWEFAHDALGRVVRSIDPDGGVSRAEYDAVGAPTATTDPSGVRREIRDARHGLALEVVEGLDSTRLDLDRLGRLVSETSADGATTLTRYDLCGRPVEVVDPVGGLTRVIRDAAGRVVTLIRPSGAEVGYTYDAAGRVESVTDETGATTRRVHDADGRVVEQHLPTGEVAETRFDAAGRVVARRVPGVGTTTYAYDAAGRVAEARDPRNGRRRFGYDAAGQLVTATDGNGGVTAYAYDVNGRCTALTHPDGGVTRREYDGGDRVVAETDPLGRRTTAEYDAAGRQVAQTDPTGSRTEWHHDEHGLLASTWVDGVERSSIERDLAGRSVRITDRSGTDGSVVVHEMVWDARGLLTSRTRDGRGPSWTYDADGACTALTMPDGTTTSYARDAAGRLVGVSHPLLGACVIERDGSGRMVSASAGGTTQRWSYDAGFLAVHEVVGGARTGITRDEGGRIRRVDVADGAASQSTSYSYDEAHQLVSAATTTGAGEQMLRWRYDAAGRMVAESADGVSRHLDYDLAGQITRVRIDDEDVVTYRYDGAGRRTVEQYADGSTRGFDWSATGWLAAITATDRVGDASRTDLVVDALGELASVDGVEVVADSANPWNGLLALGGEQVTRAGAFTGLSGASGSTWADPGWRDARSVGPDPWAGPENAGSDRSTAGAGFGLSATGELSVAGLEWMGNRVYDPASRGFLSVDPLDPTTGSGWSGNPYSYAGNDPLHSLDPMGLHPVTDAELRAYNSSNGIAGTVNAAGKWLKNNWEYVAGGAMVVAGGVLMATGVGGPAGMMLISAGADTIIQKATTGEVNWGQVAVSGALGAVPFGALAKGATAAKGALMATRAGTAARTTLTAVRSGVKSAGERVLGKVTATGGRMLGRLHPEPHVPEGIVYRRTDLLGSKPYIGQAKSEARYLSRQAEHARAHPDADFEFEVVGRANPGRELDRMEEFFIRREGGPTNLGNPDGGLANLRHQMSETRYQDAGGDLW